MLRHSKIVNLCPHLPNVLLYLPLRLFLLSVVAFTPLQAQPVVDALHQDWRGVYYSEESGLPSENVIDLIETSTGILWAVTDKGIAWYDGYRWSSPISQDSIPNLQPTGTSSNLSGGILAVINGSLFSGNEHGFEQVAVSYGGQPIRILKAIPLNPENLLLMNTEQLYLYRSGTVSLFDLPNDPLLKDALHLGRIDLLRTKNGRIWLNAPTGLYMWEGNTWRKKFPHRISELVEKDETGSLFVSTNPEHLGIWTWDSREAPVQEIKNNVTSFDVSSDGTTLAILAHEEVWTKTNQTWKQLTNAPEYLSLARFIRFQQNGDLWVGVPGGLYRHRLSSNRWKRHTEAGTYVNELLRTRNGNLWVASNEGVTLLKKNTAQQLSFPDQEPLKHITGLAEDHDGGIWISSTNTLEGVYRWQNNTWSHIELEPGPADVNVGKIKNDLSGNLWFLGLSLVENGNVISRESGAYQYIDGKLKKWSKENGLLSGRVFAFAESPAGTYWFGTERGLSRWQNGNWSHWHTKELSSNSSVLSIAVSPSGQIWFSHWENGIAYIDDQDKIHRISTRAGLVDNRIRNLQFGRDGVLWVSTHNGISLVKGDIHSAIGHSEGLTHSDVWVVLPEEDQVLIGTNGGGLYALDPFEYKQPPPLVYIKDLVINNQHVHVEWGAYSWQGSQKQQDILTRYRIDEEPWTPWTRTRHADPLEVPSGSHTFTVQAVNSLGQLNQLGASTRFTIQHPYYRKPLFLFFLATWIVATLGVGLIYWKKHKKYVDAIKYQALLLGEVHDSVVSTDMNFIIKTWNKGAERIYGYSSKEAIGQHAKLIYTSEQLRYLKKKVLNEFENNDAGDYLVRNKHKSGQEIYVRLRLKKIHDHANNPIGFISCSNDVTARRKEELARKKSERQLQEAQRIARMGSWEWNVKDNSMIWSQEVNRILGEPGHLSTRTLDDFLKPIPRGYRKFVYQRLHWALHDQKPFKIEHGILRSDSSERIVLLQGEVMRHESGEAQKVVGSIQDITEQKKTERKLIEARDAAEEMNRLKNSFLENMSHEFRTPLNAILGFANLLTEELPRDKIELVKPIIAGGERLLQTLNSVLDLSMLEAGAFRMNITRLDVCPIISTKAAEFQERAQKKGLDLRVFLPSEPVEADVDQVCLERILNNLISNAIKFTDTGYVEITMYEENDNMVISIQDTGSGISPTFLPHLFKAFKQESDGKARIHEGNGLGLTITKELIELMGGNITINSIKNEGALFTITLPRFASSPGVDSQVKVPTPTE